MDSKFKFVEVVTGSAANRGKFLEVEHNWLIDYYGKENPVDCYHSAFMHTNDYVQHYKQKKENKYDGAVGSEILYWDLDNTDLDVALTDVKKLYQNLLSLECNTNNIYVYYSGCKGFHIVYLCPELAYLSEHHKDINNIVKNACSIIAKGLSSFDGRIYDKTRIFRSPNSINSKTGLYKVLLPTLSLSIDAIKEYAKEQHEYKITYEDIKSPKIMNIISEALYYTDSKQSENKFTSIQLVEGIKNGFSEGDRNNGLASVAGLLRRRNISTDFINAILSSINSRAVSPLSDREVQSIVNSIDKYSIDPLFVEPTLNDIVTLDQASKSWYDLRQKTKDIDFGFSHINDAIPYFDPAQVLLVVARAGIGKTTIGMQLINNISESLNNKSLFISLEMPKESIFARIASIEANKEFKDKYDITHTTNLLLSDESKEFVSKTIAKWERVLIVDKDCLSLNQIETYYNLAREKASSDIGCLLIDYGGLINGTDDYESISAIARGIKSLAKRLQTRIITIVQLSRKAGDGTIPATIDMLRDTGAWEEAADYIIGLWRSQTDIERLHASVIKNRFGEPNQRFDILNKGLFLTSVNPDYTDDRLIQPVGY